jgi:phosphonopyruvate decarboxylase
MVDPNKILKFLEKKKINFFTGVPDSTLKNFTLLLENNKKIKHYPVYNEGSAVSLAIGYHLSKKKVACVYLQNSGLSNAINPLISIAHKKVYSIPCLLMIGWRGSPHTIKDEPQHNIKGKITKNILKLLNIRTIILRTGKDFNKLGKLINFANKTKQAVACLIENNTIKKIKDINKAVFQNADISRIFFLEELLVSIKKNTKIISTTGFTSREIFQLRKEKNYKKGKDFFMVGGMGHAGMVALGVSTEKKNQVICVDGDGSVLMHFGSLKAQAIFAGSNFKHILLNNACHESVGGQRTFAEKTNFTSIAKILGYKYIEKISSKKELKKNLKKFLQSKGPSFLEIKIKTGTLKNLLRPNNFLKIKKSFMK